MPSAHVQTVKVDTSGTSVAMPSMTVTSGNLLTVFVRAGTTVAGGTTTVSDNLSNTWTPFPAMTNDGNGNSAGGWYAKNITGGSCTITIANAVGPSIRANASEWSGLDTTAPADQGSTPNTGTNTALTTSSITTTHAADMLVTFVATNGSETYSAGTVGSGTGTIPTNGFTTKTAICYHHETSTGTYTGAISWGVSDQFIGCIDSFKDSGGGGGGSPLRRNSSLSGLGASGPFFHDPLSSN